MTSSLQKNQDTSPINSIFERSQSENYRASDADLKHINHTIDLLDRGEIRCIHADNSVNEIAKKAIICYFRLNPSVFYPGTIPSYDKVPNKLNHMDCPPPFRVCPPTHIRWGAYVGKSCVLMPSFINMGAYIDEGTMIDTWSTIGSCAQIGKHCHISGGTGIGGVLEPLGSQPVVIGNNCFIGARCEVAEGIHIDDGAVIAAGTILTASTKIYHKDTGKITHGYIPKDAVVIPTYLPDESKQFTRYAAMITKYATSSTRKKIGINALLRF